MLTTLPHLAPFPHVCAAVSGRHPQTPATPPPLHVWPIPAQVVEQSTMRPQLFGVGPHLPPMQVADIASSVHALQEPVAVLQPSEHAMSEPH